MDFHYRQLPNESVRDKPKCPPLVAKRNVFGKTVINNFFNDYRSMKKLLIPFLTKTPRFHVIQGILLFPALFSGLAGKRRNPCIT